MIKGLLFLKTPAKTLDLADDRTREQKKAMDDEYAYLGVKDPKVLLTTSRDPSSRLSQFLKELRMLFPQAQRMNRGGYVVKDLMQLARSHEMSDVIIVHEHRGEPDGMVVCHLPFGPTAYFGQSPNMKSIFFLHMKERDVIKTELISIT